MQLYHSILNLPARPRGYLRLQLLASCEYTGSCHVCKPAFVVTHPQVTHPQVNAGEELLLSIPDSFGRLIVHGLAEFHGLLSASRTVGGDRFVAVYTKPSTTTATAAESSHVRRQHSDITCTDVLMAIHELGAQGFNQHTLGRYVRSLHGMSCDDVDSSDYVFV